MRILDKATKGLVPKLKKLRLAQSFSILPWTNDKLPKMTKEDLQNLKFDMFVKEAFRKGVIDEYGNLLIGEKKRNFLDELNKQL